MLYFNDKIIIDFMKGYNTMKKDNKEQNMKKKRHFDPARGAVRIIALLLVVIMLLATCGTLVYYLLNI